MNNTVRLIINQNRLSFLDISNVVKSPKCNLENEIIEFSKMEQAVEKHK